MLIELTGEQRAHALEKLDRMSTTIGDCRLWQRGMDARGYGHVWFYGKTWKAHRLSYAVHVGPLDPSLTIDHLCKNPSCITPEHLEQVSAAVNALRGDGPCARNARMHLCPKGHSLEKHPYNRGRRCLVCLRAYARNYHKTYRRKNRRSLGAEI